MGSTSEPAAAASGPVVERVPVTVEELADHGADLERDFPGSSIDEFRRYPVLSEGGWHMVIKHQPTLRSAVRERWDLLGPIKLLSDGLEL